MVTQRQPRIDKSSISEPIRSIIHTTPDARTPVERARDLIRQKLLLADADGLGVDIDHIRVLCNDDADEESLSVVKSAGGWAKFTLSVKTGISTFRENHRTIVLRQEYEDAIADLSIQDANQDSLDMTKPNDQRPFLSSYNRDIVAKLESLRKQKKTDFPKDRIRRDAMHFLRAVTLMMRFRESFPGRSYESIIDMVKKEQTLSLFGGLDQFLEMCVQAGYLHLIVRDAERGHAATTQGASLIKAVKYVRHETQHNELLEQQLLENYNSLRPTKESDKTRRRIVGDIQKHLDDRFPEAGFLVEMFGSGGNGLYFPGSDLDVCAFYTSVPPRQVIDIRQLAKTLYRARWCKDVVCIGHAKIPVIKLRHSATELPVDISLENTIAIENTKLIQLYMNLDTRTKAIAFALKVWCKSRAISHPEDGTLSSYSWTLLLIHYLQRTSPPVLPNLQPSDELEPFYHSYNGELIACQYIEDPEWEVQDKEPLNILFCGFFDYYSTFDFDEHVVNLKPVFEPDEVPILKTTKGTNDWLSKAINIEDPFIEDRNTAVGCSKLLATWTVDEIRRASRILSEGGTFADIVGFAIP